MRNSFLIVLLLFFIASCHSQTGKNNIDQEAVELNNEAQELVMNAGSSKDSILDAIELYNKAIQIQPDYYAAYWNKYTALDKLGKNKDGLKTLMDLEKAGVKNPLKEAYLKSIIGVLIERQGDSINAQKKYKQADSIYRKVLDTLSKNNPDYWLRQGQRALNLQLLNNSQEVDILLSKMKAEITDSDLVHKAMIQDIATRTRKEILNR